MVTHLENWAHVVSTTAESDTLSDIVDLENQVNCSDEAAVLAAVTRAVAERRDQIALVAHAPYGCLEYGEWTICPPSANGAGSLARLRDALASDRDEAVYLLGCATAQVPRSLIRIQQILNLHRRQGIVRVWGTKGPLTSRNFEPGRGVRVTKSNNPLITAEQASKLRDDPQTPVTMWLARQAPIDRDVAIDLLCSTSAKVSNDIAAPSLREFARYVARDARIGPMVFSVARTRLRFRESTLLQVWSGAAYCVQLSGANMCVYFRIRKKRASEFYRDLRAKIDTQRAPSS
ncbi:MAG: hypothetical protein IPH44_43290 [Myxococcales bacterium]|nr:hypothetical protein [Myxococcales bacterium]MBK7192777.1 hypothetical protein [Myxococcales bacterium]MBP6846456.1 hypothetical protein [Kofleriaceae bacterium]